MTETENLLNNFKEIVDGDYSNLAHALRDLQASTTAAPQSTPPLLPSQAHNTIELVGRTAKRSVGFIVSVSSAVLASTLAAAALNGVGPKPIVEFAQTAAKNIESLTKDTVGNLFTSTVSPSSNQAADNSTPLPTNPPSASATSSAVAAGTINTSTSSIVPVPEIAYASPLPIPTSSATAESQESAHPENTEGPAQGLENSVPSSSPSSTLQGQPSEQSATPQSSQKENSATTNTEVSSGNTIENHSAGNVSDQNTKING
jgi:hypothetical protein